MTRTAERVQLLIAEHLNFARDRVHAGASIVGDLNADSLDTMELLMVAEQEFDIVIDDEEAANVVTVGDACDLVERKLKENRNA